MSAGDIIGMVSGILGILATIVATLAWARHKVEKWLKNNTTADVAAIEEHLTKKIIDAVHTALPSAPIIADTYAATRQLYNNGGSSMADKVDKAVRLGEGNSAQLNAMTGVLATNTMKLSSMETGLAELNGKFLAHVAQH